MNFSAVLNWKTLIISFVFCFIFLLSSTVEADRIRIIHRKAVPTTKLYVSKSSPTNYAKKYSYGSPIPRYSTETNFRERRRNGKGSRNYANGYRNWSPENKFNNGNNKARVDNYSRGHQKKRKEPLFLERDPPFTNKQSLRSRPQREGGPPLQRPLPPKQANDFDEDYYFPEEATQPETKFEYERPKKRRRNPGESERVIRGPDLTVPLFRKNPNKLFKQKNRDSPFSYSTFIQHPNSDDDDFEEEEDKQQYVQPAVKNKKKKSKNKSNLRKKIKEEEFYSGDRDEELDGFQSLTFNNFETSVKKSKKPNKKPFKDFDEDFFNDKNRFNIPQTVGYIPNNIGLQGIESNFNTFKDSPRPQITSNFNSAFSQNWNNIIETTARPVIQQPQNGLLFPQFSSNQFNFQNSFQGPKIQPIPTFASPQQGNFFSQPDNIFRNIPTLNAQPSFNYNYNQVNNQPSHAFSNGNQPSHSFSNGNQHSNAFSNGNQHSNAFSNSVYPSQPSPSFPNFYKNSVSVDKSVPIYESSQTYFNYNNPFAESQSGKHQGHSQIYKQTINNHISPSYVTPIPSLNPQRVEDENDFVKKHQSLYNKGLRGVPVQGDGYGSSNSAKKDYDIGYGDFQFDENPSS